MNPRLLSLDHLLPSPLRTAAASLRVTTDGRQVVWINPIFYGMPTRESQVEPEQLRHVCVRIAPAPGFTHTHERTIVARLRERMGDVTVRVERVDVVPRSANGKVRAVISRLSAAERAEALGSMP